MAISCKFCTWCLDPDIIWEKSHNSTCKVLKGDIKGYTCNFEKCRSHMWLCNYHRKANKQHMEKQKDTLEKKGFTLSLTSWIMHSSDQPPETAQYTPVRSIEEATRNLTRREQQSSKDRNIKVVPPPVGQPMFLFFHVKGKTKGVNVFFDKGCSTACFREGVPGGELNGEVIAKGPS